MLVTSELHGPILESTPPVERTGVRRPDIDTW
jgi:hypothetical protein